MWCFLGSVFMILVLRFWHLTTRNVCNVFKILIKFVVFFKIRRDFSSAALKSFILACMNRPKISQSRPRSLWTSLIYITHKNSVLLLPASPVSTCLSQFRELMGFVRIITKHYAYVATCKPSWCYSRWCMWLSACLKSFKAMNRKFAITFRGVKMKYGHLVVFVFVF
jgi:hypothetical protein